MIQLVFAHKFGAFGAADGMPWPHISQDFKNFKARTEGTSLIMGAKTFASLPGKLKGRLHYVLTDRDRPGPVAKNGDIPDIPICADNLKSILENAHKYDTKYSVIGGKALLEQALPFADKVIVTHIDYTLDKPITQNLDNSFLRKLDKDFVQEEMHLYRDGTNTICENVLIKKLYF